MELRATSKIPAGSPISLRRPKYDASRLNYDASFTKVKNKIAYHSINLMKKLKYRRIVINKQRAKVSGMYDFELELFGKEFP